MSPHNKRKKAIAKELFLLFARKQRTKASLLTPEEAWEVMKPEAKMPWFIQAEIAIQAYEGVK